MLIKEKLLSVIFRFDFKFELAITCLFLFTNIACALNLFNKNFDFCGPKIKHTVDSMSAIVPLS